jgi:tight adherence protein C
MLATFAFASAAAIFIHNVPSSWKLKNRYTMSANRRAKLREAIGLVHGNEDGLARVAKTQIISATSAALIMFFVIAPELTAPNALAGCLFVAAGWQTPLILSRSKEKRRRAEIELELSDALGALVMGVEAGLTLESVMSMYVLKRSTALAHEFSHVLDRIGVGVPRATALHEMRDRTPTSGISMFVAAVIQNQKLGTPLARVLRQQGETARRRRRQAVEEHAAKLSLKMIFPTVFCILPTIIVVIVGPAIVRLIEALPK